MSKRTENKYLAVSVKVDGEEVVALIRPFGGDHCRHRENKRSMMKRKQFVIALKQWIATVAIAEKPKKQMKRWNIW